MRPSRVIPLLTLVAVVAAAGRADAQRINYSVQILDTSGANADLYQPISEHLLAAADRWSGYFRPVANANAVIRMEFTNAVPRGSGRSTDSAFVGQLGGRDLFEQGMGAMLRTGLDVNGATHDIEVQLNPDYIRREFWFDPNPSQRTAAVPADRLDAMSVMLHELGHAYGFNGWGSHTTGEPPATYLSTWDQHVSFDGSNILFNGPNARYVYGQPVPVTGGNNFHLGNDSPGLGSDLLPDLMNGVVFHFGTRYDISLLDVAVLRDAGVPTTPIPEPAGLLVVLAVTAVGIQVRSKRHHANAKNPTPNNASTPQAVHTTSA